MKSRQDPDAGDIAMPKLGPARYPNLRAGTAHVTVWLREPRICRTRGCMDSYTTLPVCRGCHSPTETL